MIGEIAIGEIALAEYFESKYKPLRLVGKSPATIAEYRSQIRVLNEFFVSGLVNREAAPRPVRLSDLSDELLAGAMQWQIDRGRAAPTANKLMRHIAAIWSLASRKCEVRLPDRQIEPLPEEQREPRTWLVDDFHKMLARCDELSGKVGPLPASRWWRALLLTIVNTGGRISAVMACRGGDVDFSRREITLAAAHQKDRAEMRFELAPATEQALDAIKQSGGEFLFPWPYDGGNLTRGWNCLHRHYRKRILIPAGLADPKKPDPKQLFHNLRRFTATLVADAEGEEFARDYLGHTSVKVTRRYLDRGQMRRKRSAVAHLPLPAPKQVELRLFDAS